MGRKVLILAPSLPNPKPCPTPFPFALTTPDISIMPFSKMVVATTTPTGFFFKTLAKKSASNEKGERVKKKLV